MKRMQSSQTLSYLGRRSGLPHRLRVRSAKVGEEFVIRVSNPSERRWWRNFLSPWPITIQDGNQVLHASGAVAIVGSPEAERAETAFFARYPVSPRHERAYDRQQLLFLCVKPRRAAIVRPDFAGTNGQGRQG